MNAQRTLRRRHLLRGIGLHSGRKVTLSLKPAPAGSGIRFRRSDLGGLEVPAHVNHVGGINYATGLMRDAVRVDTVEHLLAALVSLGIDNVDRRAELAGSADHGRQRGAVRLPDSGSRRRSARGAAPVS